jgi:hypothetical protein
MRDRASLRSAGLQFAIRDTSAMNCTQAHFFCLWLKHSSTMKSLPQVLLYIYTVSRMAEGLKEKLSIAISLYVNEIDEY